MKSLLPVLVVFFATSCSVSSNTGPYTGVIRINANAEVALIEEPSTIGGACEGWNAIEIRRPGAAGTGRSNDICWELDGDNIIVTDRTGAQWKPMPTRIWSD